MDEIVPRYEFRAFAQSFGLVEERLRAGRPSEQIRESVEFYLVSAANMAHNVKIRYETLDIKELIVVRDGLEQWRPVLKAEFPLLAEMIRDRVLPLMGVEAGALGREAYTVAQLIEEVVRPHPGLAAAQVFKRRFGFVVHGCTAEIAELLINGAAIRSVAVESEDLDGVREARTQLGLDAYENVNYPRAIKRVLGLAPLPAMSTGKHQGGQGDRGG
jgi:hypothetical protein